MQRQPRDRNAADPVPAPSVQNSSGTDPGAVEPVCTRRSVSYRSAETDIRQAQASCDCV